MRWFWKSFSALVIVWSYSLCLIVMSQTRFNVWWNITQAGELSVSGDWLHNCLRFNVCQNDNALLGPCLALSAYLLEMPLGLMISNKMLCCAGTVVNCDRSWIINGILAFTRRNMRDKAVVHSYPVAFRGKLRATTESQTKPTQLVVWVNCYLNY